MVLEEEGDKLEDSSLIKSLLQKSEMTGQFR
jgi:hypothetical protein